MSREYKGKWQASLMQCDKCANRWAATHPVTCEYLECPICHHMNPAPFVEEETKT